MLERECIGSKVRGTKPERREDGSWLVFLPIYEDIAEVYYRPAHHRVQSSNITSDSVVTWAGNLRCLPAEYQPMNQNASQNTSVDVFVAVIKNPDGEHLAPINISTSNAGGEVAIYPYRLNPCLACPNYIYGVTKSTSV